MSYARRQVMKALAARGFAVAREGRSHTIVRGPAGQQIPVPRHGEIKPGTARAIARQARADWPEFEREIS